jgi:putative ABC transport system permease protein
MLRTIAFTAAFLLPCACLADDPTFVVVRSIRPEVEPHDRPVILNYGLKYEDFDRLLANVPVIEEALPIREIDKEARLRNRAHDARVVGTTARYLELAGLEIDRGRNLTDDDHQKYENVAVLGPAVAEALFPTEDPIGQSIKLGSDYYKVVGVAKRTGDSARSEALLGREVADDVLIPVNTCRLRFGERIVDNRSGSLRAEEAQLTRLILQVQGDPEAARRTIEATLEPFHPKGDVEVRVVTPRTRSD